MNNYFLLLPLTIIASTILFFGSSNPITFILGCIILYMVGYFSRIAENKNIWKEIDLWIKTSNLKSSEDQIIYHKDYIKRENSRIKKLVKE